MGDSKLKTAYKLSALVAVLAAVQAAGGLFLPNLYRDIPLVTAAMKGTDIVTLALVVPLLIWAMAAARHGSQKAQLVWMGLLLYMFCNYAFYLFVAVGSLISIVVLLRHLKPETKIH